MLNQADKKIVFIVGTGVLLIGIVMILMWWPDVVSFFKGVLGMALAVGGLVMMHGRKA